jgi:hypothetical protein
LLTVAVGWAGHVFGSAEFWFWRHISDVSCFLFFSKRKTERQGYPGYICCFQSSANKARVSVLVLSEALLSVARHDHAARCISHPLHLRPRERCFTSPLTAHSAVWTAPCPQSRSASIRLATVMRGRRLGHLTELLCISTVPQLLHFTVVQNFCV